MKKNKKGFTLAELLIVVAIIAVLVAIAIPVLNNSLEKSRQAADAANIRAAYAQAAADMMVNDKSGGVATTTAKMKTSGSFTRITEGDTLAGIEFSKLADAHVGDKYVTVYVTTKSVAFYATDAQFSNYASLAGASSHGFASYNTDNDD